MSGHDFEFEEFYISESAGAPFHDIHSLLFVPSKAPVDIRKVVRQDTTCMSQQSVGEFDEGFYAASPFPGHPIFQESLGSSSFVWIRPELPEVFLEVVSGGQRLINSQSFSGPLVFPFNTLPHLIKRRSVKVA